MNRPLKVLLLALPLIGCGGEEMSYGPAELEFEGAAIDSAPTKADKPVDVHHKPLEKGEVRRIGFKALSLEDLGEEGMEDLLDAQLYPDEYSKEERSFPEQVQSLDGEEVVLRGYMIPTLTEEGKVMKFLVVADLLSCCFGGAPKADQWVKAEMVPEKSCEYYAYVPILVHGRFKIEVIEDEAGYASGCYHIVADKVERDR